MTTMALVRLRLSEKPRECREEGYTIGGFGMTGGLCVNGAGAICGSTAAGYGPGTVKSWRTRL